jgi:hypothetical protein
VFKTQGKTKRPNHEQNMKNSIVGAALVLSLATLFPNFANGQGGKSSPATVTSGSNSVAALLHYPEKARAANIQTAIPFYCEVEANGKAAHIQLYGPKDKTVFRTAVLKALEKGRFQPATSGGQPVPVMVGGTVMFMFTGGTPTVALTLSSADKQKTASLTNYIQPQMLSSSADFRRKIWKLRYDNNIHLRPGVHPSAIVIAQVDAHGNLVGTRIEAETPPGADWGPLLVKGFQGAKFIPALSNGAPVAGQYDFIANYDNMFNPDYGAPTGSNIKDDRYDR